MVEEDYETARVFIILKKEEGRKRNIQIPAIPLLIGVGVERTVGRQLATVRTIPKPVDCIISWSTNPTPAAAYYQRS